jgi:tetratricopeptide (TPR) repeat protein
MNTGAGTFIAFATAPGQTADDNRGGTNGLFTMYLLKSLRRAGLSLDDVFNEVRENVYQASNGEQLPWIGSSVIGKFYLRPYNTNAVLSAPAMPSTAGLLKTALGYRKAGKLAESLAAFNRIVEQDSHQAQALFERGMLHASMEEYELAIRDFSRTIELQPEHAVAYNARALAYISKGEYEIALPDFERAAAYLPRDAAVFYNRGLALACMGRHEAAIASYKQALAIRPDYTAALVNRAISYASLEDYKQALRDCDAAIRILPGWAVVYHTRADIKRASGDATGADQDAKTARALEQ